MPSRYEEMQRHASTRAQAKAVAVDNRAEKRRRALLSWAILIAVGAMLLLTTFAHAATVKSKRGYSLASPVGWRVAQSGQMGTDLILLAPKANGFQSNVNVIVQPLPRGMNMKRGRAELDRLYPRMFAGFKWISRGTTKVGGTTGLLNIASHSTGTPPRKLLMYQVVAPRGKYYYSFTGTSLLSQSAKFKPQFETIFRSIKWTK